MALASFVRLVSKLTTVSPNGERPPDSLLLPHWWEFALNVLPKFQSHFPKPANFTLGVKV